MYKLINVLCLSLLLTTAGCVNNAPKGMGGFAEHHQSNSENHPIGLENALYFEQQLSQRHLDALVVAGAATCFPASIKQSKLRQLRITRELHAGLDSDAANDLMIQRDQLTRLARRLNYVQMHDSCLSTLSYKGNKPANMLNEIAPKVATQDATTLNKEQKNQLFTLLNNNNQFVFNSAQLNPHYIGQLSQATQILREYPRYHLILTGHSDSIGSAAVNLKLSLERATLVERYLLKFGLNPNSIQVNDSGYIEPLFSGKRPAVRLVNRRVSIKLIDANHSSKSTQQ